MRLGLLLLIDLIVVVAMQLAATVQDIRTREISDWTWIVGGLVSAPLGFYVSYVSHELGIYIASVIVGAVLALAIYYTGAMGGADAKSLAVLSASVPTYVVSNPAVTIINITPLSILINSLIIALVIYIPYNFLVSLRYLGNCRALRDMGAAKYLYILILMCVPAHRVLRKPSNYSISQVFGDGEPRPLVSLGIRTEDPTAVVGDWLSKGYIDVDTPILVTYHIPFILPITLGLVIYLALHMNFLTLALSLL
ncbi:A24 family peptidase [Vulcanisaeta thermophila]|uniref:A24 family peptidase n=1 Tax=Vulcanisaeta thermophila TaxID=867917 RepID=UPI001EE23D26|nr:A24 family peptidase [Vulcanisaeta thermophila]